MEQPMDEYHKLLSRINTPRVWVDNKALETVTVVTVESVKRDGLLLEVVQMLADLELCIHKAYISSDGEWFMKVFHVTDSCGKKLTNERLINYIMETVAQNHEHAPEGKIGGSVHTVIELTGRDRPGLLSEICALLAHHKCTVLAAQFWTHNLRIASHIHVVDDEVASAGAPEKVMRIEGEDDVVPVGGPGGPEKLTGIVGGDDVVLGSGLEKLTRIVGEDHMMSGGRPEKLTRSAGVFEKKKTASNPEKLTRIEGEDDVALGGGHKKLTGIAGEFEKKKAVCNPEKLMRIEGKDDVTPGGSLKKLTRIAGGFEKKKTVCNPEKLMRMKESLYNVVKGGDVDARVAYVDLATSVTHTERRLHQLLLAVRDYEPDFSSSNTESYPPYSSSSSKSPLIHSKITVANCSEKGYSIINIDCRDRSKVLFDVLCTLTDLRYVVFHAIINSNGETSFQEYYIRHEDGCALNSEAERQRVIQFLRATIEHRVSQGLRLELCTRDCVSLLSKVTRIFREHGLLVRRASVTRQGDKVVNVFYLTDAAGNCVDPIAMDLVRREIGHAFLEVKAMYLIAPACSLTRRSHVAANSKHNMFSFGIGNILLGMPTQFLYNLGLIRSFCS